MTKTVLKGAIAAVAVLTGAQVALAEGGLVINGELEMIIEAPAADHLKGSLTTVYSGWVFRDVDTQAMQMDDFDNPGMLYVDQGEGMWNAPAGTSEKSCADCHGDASESMAGVRTVYPKWNEAAGEVRSLQMQINTARTKSTRWRPISRCNRAGCR
jgi:sulfur-oxidizing protein SoxA